MIFTREIKAKKFAEVKSAPDYFTIENRRNINFDHSFAPWRFKKSLSRLCIIADLKTK
jgi:hypothetical protein